MRTISVVNQKGGCGKTTTAVNLAAAFATAGRRVMLVDMDPQGHATMGLGFDPDAFERTVLDGLISREMGVSQVSVGTDVPWLDLLPSNVGLAAAEMQLQNVPAKERILRQWLRGVSSCYDMCVIDCPPSLGLLMLNALVASTDVLIPVQAHFYAFEGLKRLLETVRLLKERYHACSARMLGLLLTFVEGRPVHARKVQLQLRELFADLVFDIVIHKSVRLIEAPEAGKSIFTYAPDSIAAQEYAALADEVEVRLRGGQPIFAGT